MKEEQSINVLTFLADRLLYILMYIGNVSLLLLIVQLDFLQNGTPLQQGNIVYIGLLSIFGLALFLSIDYVRKRPFYQQINGVKQSNNMVADVSNIQSGVTKEQRIIQELVHQHQRDYLDQLAAYRERTEQQHHFTNQWVHYMKTPASVIDLNIQLANNMDRQELLDSIQEETERLTEGLDMVLHTARLEKFEMDVNVQKVNLVPLLRKVINDNKKLLIRYGIFPKISAQHEEMIVETDEKWIRFILNQLVLNAIKYSQAKQKEQAEDEPRSEPEKQIPEKQNHGDQIHVILEKDQTGVHVHIQDQGVGIAAQDLPRIFNAFFTGENGRDTAESTGMGLYLSKEVCQRLGHRLTAQSVLHEGTTMTVTFPFSATIHQDMENMTIL